MTTATAQPRLSNTAHVRPFDPNRFFGVMRYGGATEVKVAAIAAHRSGELVALNLIGNDTAISAVLSKFFLNEKVEYLPGEENPWNGPRLLGRLPINYRRINKRLQGVKNTNNYLVYPRDGDIGFNLQNPPEIPEDLIPKKQQADGPKQAPLAVKTETKATFRYVYASPLSGDDMERGVIGVPSFGAVLGQMVGMRMIVLRSREAAMRPIVDEWINQLWLRGLAKGLITALPGVGIQAWAIKNSLLNWNTLVSEGVTAGWLPLPRETVLIEEPSRIALAAD